MCADTRRPPRVCTQTHALSTVEKPPNPSASAQTLIQNKCWQLRLLLPIPTETAA